MKIFGIKCRAQGSNGYDLEFIPFIWSNEVYCRTNSMGVKGLGKIMRFLGFDLTLNDKTKCVIK